MSEAPLPRCVFCDAPWTEAMLKLYDAGTRGATCACCAVYFPDFEDAPPAPPPQEHVALPDTLDCEACGKTLYRLLKD